jgi:tRNA (guanine-N7-)-methyltransferase
MMNDGLMVAHTGTPSAAHSAELLRRREELRGPLLQVLGASSVFTWELGCGHGHFLTAYAQAHPDKLCVGIDIVSERIERALRKRDRARLSNLTFLRAEARLFLDAIPPGVSFSELFILFPDPWPKLRHHKHRVLQPEFLKAAASRASNRSQLCFRTDSTAYFEYADRIVRSHPRWQVSNETWPFEFTTVFQSRAASYQSLIARPVDDDAS